MVWTCICILPTSWVSFLDLLLGRVTNKIFTSLAAYNWEHRELCSFKKKKKKGPTHLMIFTIFTIPTWEIWPVQIGQTSFLFHFPISWASLFPWGEVSKRCKESNSFFPFISEHSTLLNLMSMSSMWRVSENADPPVRGQAWDTAFPEAPTSWSVPSP